MDMQTEVQEVYYHFKVSGNWKFCQFHLGYVDFVLQKSLNFIGCHGDIKFIFSNIFFKNHKRKEAKTLHICKSIYPIHKCVLISLCICFHRYGDLWFPNNYKCHSLPCYCSYF